MERLSGALLAQTRKGPRKVVLTAKILLWGWDADLDTTGS